MIEEFEPSSRSSLGDGLALDLVEEIDDDVILYHAQAVEVFSYRSCQLVFALSPKLFAPRDCGRVEADATSLGENPLVVIARECGRGVEAVCAAICVEDFSFEGRPLKLENQRQIIVSKEMSIGGLEFVRDRK